MRVRKLLNELLVISPVLFILCITVEARTRAESFVPYQYSQTLQQRLEAYVEPVRLTESLLQRGTTNVDPIQIRNLAETWRDLTQQGVLLSLPPEAPEDTTKEGIKAQVRVAAEHLASAIQQVARREIYEGKFEQAANDAVLAIEATQCIKFSDLYSVGLISVRQSSSLLILKDVVPNLNSEQKQVLARRLNKASQHERSLADAVLAQRRVWRFEHGKMEQIDKGEMGMMLTMARQLDSTTSPGKLGNLRSELSDACKEHKDGSLLPDFRFAWSARRNELNSWNRIQQMLM